jgi:hypothetical protein
VRLKGERPRDFRENGEAVTLKPGFPDAMRFSFLPPSPRPTAVREDLRLIVHKSGEWELSSDDCLF